MGILFTVGADNLTRLVSRIAKPQHSREPPATGQAVPGEGLLLAA